MTLTLPREDSPRYHLLAALRQGPGTFYQVCERAGIDIEDQHAEDKARLSFERLIGDFVHMTGVTYSLTAEARESFGEIKPTPSAGEIAGPAFRGIYDPRTVFITRRPEGARV
jgi:hypothetical protein